LIGANLSNQPNSTGGNTVNVSNAQRASNHGTEQNSQAITHVSLADSQTNATAYAILGGGPPGFTYDVRTSGQPNYGVIDSTTVPSPSAPTGPTLCLQAGTGGVYSCCARLSTTDNYGNDTWNHEYPICFDFGEGAAAGYVILHGSEPYETSVYE
jgi:hypothetical protein